MSYVWDVEGNVRFAGWRRSPDLARQSATRPKPARSGLRTERQQWVVPSPSCTVPRCDEYSRWRGGWVVSESRDEASLENTLGFNERGPGGPAQRDPLSW